MSHGGSPRRLAPAFAYGAVAFAALGAETALAATGPSWLLRLRTEPGLARALVAGAGLVGVLLLVGGLALIAWSRRMPRRTEGRGRAGVLGSAGAGHALAATASAFVMSHADAPMPFDDALAASLPPAWVPWLHASATVAAMTGAVAIGAIAALWLLLPRALRERAWAGFDVFLLVTIGLAWWFLPAQPPASDTRALLLPALRHTLTTLGVLRLTVRLVPTALDLTEAVGFRSLVASRHLRAEKSGFLAAIGLLSVLAVSVSCMALTITLSVMGGFRNDLKRKILGNNAHIVVDRDRATIPDWQPLLATTANVQGVVGVSPYVTSEVMLSSASNLATAVLRGIDPQRIGTVNDLPRNLKSGSLDYLVKPQKLLELPPDALEPPWLRDSTLRRLPADAPAPVADAGVGDTAVRDAGLIAAPDAGTVPSPDAEGLAREAAALTRRISRLEEFLRDRPDAPAHAEQRDVLPGIIVGQELARALRLFLGDEVNVVAPLGALGPTGPMPKSRPFRVAGVFYSGMYEYDMKVAYVALDTGQRFLGNDDAIGGFEVRVGDIDGAPATAAAIRTALGQKELRVRDWQELNQRLFGALALEKLAMFIALGIAILVASFCIAGTLTLMVQEKGREVAILKAMGARDRSILGVFVIEGGLIGLLGAALGLFLGYMACFAAEHFGIRMNPEVYYIDRLPVHVDATEFVLTGVAAVVICLAITLYPALLASRLRPIDALRYE